MLWQQSHMTAPGEYPTNYCIFPCLVVVLLFFFLYCKPWTERWKSILQLLWEIAVQNNCKTPSYRHEKCLDPAKCRISNHGLRSVQLLKYFLDVSNQKLDFEVGKSLPSAPLLNCTSWMLAGHDMLAAVPIRYNAQPLLHQVNACTFRKAHSGAGLVKAGRFLLLLGMSAELGRKSQSGNKDLKVSSVPGGSNQSGSYSRQNTGLDSFSRKKGRDLSPTRSFMRTTLYVLWLQEVHNHYWFGLVPSRSHSRSAHQGVAWRKGKGLVQEIWYRTLCVERKI